MAVNSKKRQRKLEKKSSKRKSKKQELVRTTTRSPVELLRSNPQLPILDCWRTASLFGQGIGQVHISRQLPGGKVVFVNFLVDVWCLGVKNLHFDAYELAKYESKMASIKREFPVVKITPAEARKLVENAVEYANALGLAPYRDYEKAKLIFGDIDPSECDKEFEFGRDGKPFFSSGPYDTPSRCREIINVLNRSCGAGNFDYLMAISPSTKMEFIDDEFDDEDEYEPRMLES